MSIDLGRRLIAAGLVSPEEVEAALFLSLARGVPFPRLLIDRGAITERGLEEELERLGGLGLRQVAGAAELVARLPRAMCRRLAALPTRLDPSTGTIDVAAADPLDPHIAAEFGFHLGAPIRVVRAPIAAIEEAIRRLELDESDSAPARARERRKTPPFPHGAPQSSVPPPVLDEAPIPLVRKAGSATSPPPPPRPVLGVAVPPPATASSSASSSSASSSLAPAPERESAPVRDSGTPLRQTLDFAAPAPFTMGATRDTAPTPHRPTLRPTGDTINYPVADLQSAPPPEPLPAPAEPPSVSFPSLPPGPISERHTPPYGTPALAPPAEPIELSTRPRGNAVSPQPPPVAPLDRAADLPPEPSDPTPPAEPPRVVRAPDGSAVLDALTRASDRDEVIRHALRGMRLVARRIAVFAVKKDGFHGWSCNVDFADPDAFREVIVPTGQPSVLATATATAIYLGPIPATAAHESLLAVMEHASTDVASVAARVGGRPALVLLADDLEDTLTGTRFLGELAKAVGEALARLLTAR